MGQHTHRFMLRSRVSKLCGNRSVDAGLRADNFVPIQLYSQSGRALLPSEMPSDRLVAVGCAEWQFTAPSL
jgi:hypothetical protein